VRNASCPRAFQTEVQRGDHVVALHVPLLVNLVDSYNIAENVVIMLLPLGAASN
jgi:hypothetical protein